MTWLEEQERSSNPLEEQEREGPKTLEGERKRKGEKGGEIPKPFKKEERRWKRLEKLREGNESAERSCKILEKVMMCWKALRVPGKAARASGGAAVAGKGWKVLEESGSKVGLFFQVSLLMAAKCGRLVPLEGADLFL